MAQPAEDRIKASPMFQGLDKEAPTAEKLSELLTEAAKKHGRTLVAELLGGKRVAEMTPTERNTVKIKIDALDAEKAGDNW
jgi:hypothetical protein